MNDVRANNCSRRPLTAAERAELRRRFAAGESIRRLTRETKHSRNTVRRVLRTTAAADGPEAGGGRPDAVAAVVGEKRGGQT